MIFTIQPFMKQNAAPSIATLLLMGLFMTACTKTNPTNPNPGGGNTTAQHPNFICQHQPGAASLTGQFVLFDLDHDTNAEKKYFIVSLIPAGTEFTDSAAVIQAPQSIDSLATGWPAQVKSAAMGTTRNIMTDAKNAVTYSVPNPWTYAPVSTSTNLYRKLNDPVYAGGKAGQKPYGNSPFSTVYYPQATYTPYSQAWRDITYYFKDGVFTDNTAGGGLRSLDTCSSGPMRFHGQRSTRPCMWITRWRQRRSITASISFLTGLTGSTIQLTKCRTGRIISVMRRCIISAGR